MIAGRKNVEVARFHTLAAEPKALHHNIYREITVI